MIKLCLNMHFAKISHSWIFVEHFTGQESKFTYKWLSWDHQVVDAIQGVNLAWKKTTAVAYPGEVYIDLINMCDVIKVMIEQERKSL